MKRFIAIILLIFTITISTQAGTLWYRSTSFASAKIINNRYYWGDWVDSDLAISIDLSNDVIIVYSQVRQIYKVVREGEVSTDNSGGQQITFPVIDQDSDRGAVRLRVESNGNAQIYVDFNDVAWVYNVVRTR